ncbi:MAG: hypothetical protein LKKZDAJK_000638 [Candidatus Fervidibacter sp.]
MEKAKARGAKKVGIDAVTDSMGKAYRRVNTPSDFFVALECIRHAQR